MSCKTESERDRERAVLGERVRETERETESGRQRDRATEGERA